MRRRTLQGDWEDLRALSYALVALLWAKVQDRARQALEDAPLTLAVYIVAALPAIILLTALYR